MAKLNFGIFGPISGKLGNLIGGTWKGIPYIKEHKPYARKKERTPAQLASSAKFKFVGEWLVPFHPFVAVGYLQLATKQTTVSAAFSQIYNTVFSGTFPDLQIDHSKMLISIGKLPGVLEPKAKLIAADTVEITWLKNTSRKTQFNDQMIVALYDRDMQIADGFVGGVNRCVQKCTFQFNEEMIGKPLDVYLGIASFDRSRISNSEYLGQINPFVNNNPL